MVASSGKDGLIPNEGRRSTIQKLATEGVALGEQLAKGKADPKMSPLADLVLAHPIIASLHRPARPGKPPAERNGPFRWAPRGPGRWTPPRFLRPRTDAMHLASYVSAEAFARSLLDILGTTTVRELQTRIENLPDNLPARDALLSLIRGAGDSVDSFRQTVERWYDEQMGRVSGWYKRWTQRKLLIVGALLAVLMNINTFAVTKALYQDEPVRQAVVAQAVSTQGCPAEAGTEREACLSRQQDVLRDLQLPVGWNLDQAERDCGSYNREACSWRLWNWLPFWWNEMARPGADGILLTILGWLLTAVAVSFGAPFWFDALGKLGSLRTAGRRPGENGPPASAGVEPVGTTRPAAPAAGGNGRGWRAGLRSR